MKIHNDAEKDIDTSNDAVKVYSRPKGQIHDVYLSDNVETNSAEYIELLRLLASAEEGDIVNLYLANFGGACHSGLRVAHAINECRACTIVIVEAPCYSMGAILALTGQALIMKPGTFLMFHNYSTTETGKAGAVTAAVKEYEKHFHYSLKYFCTPFLSKAEINKLRKDEDVYVHAGDDDILTRLKRHFKNAEYQHVKSKK